GRDPVANVLGSHLSPDSAWDSRWGPAGVHALTRRLRHHLLHGGSRLDDATDLRLRHDQVFGDPGDQRHLHPDAAGVGGPRARLSDHATPGVVTDTSDGGSARARPTPSHTE